MSNQLEQSLKNHSDSEVKIILRELNKPKKILTDQELEVRRFLMAQLYSHS